MRKKIYILIITVIITKCCLTCSNEDKKEEIVFSEPEGYVFPIEEFAKYCEASYDYDFIYYLDQNSIYIDKTIEPKIIFDDSSMVRRFPEDPKMQFVFKKDKGCTRYFFGDVYGEPFVGPVPNGNSYTFGFYATPPTGYIASGGIGNYDGAVDVIVSNDCYGYYLWGYNLTIVDLIYRTKDFPYDVYFSHFIDKYYGSSDLKCADFTLLPKNSNFSRECLIDMMETKDYHYLDFDAIKEYLSNK